ncbi:MAG: N-acetylmuramoyl-L-alanine amidase [Blastocatellia bacterium]
MKTEIIGLHNQRSQHGAGGNGTSGHHSAHAAQLYSKIVERYAILFDSPSARLRFLNNTLAKQNERQEQLQQSLRRFRFLEKTPLYSWLLEAWFYSAVLDELKAIMPSLSPQNQRAIQELQVPFSAKAYSFAHQTRHAFYAVGVVTAGLILFGLYSLVSWSARGVNSYLAGKYKGSGKAPIIVTQAGQTQNDFTETTAKYLAGYQAENVWLVERANDHERYSNGCRIQTIYEVENHPRAYYLIPRGSDAGSGELRHNPIGIVYHTNEGDMAQFSSANNDSILKNSKGAVGYIRDIKAYNYLIDRFGEIYRVVRDDHAAHHAGHSIWADSKYEYVGLNESFLGVCFESKFSTNGTLQENLTEAQITAGRALTNVLRSKYNIDDANCTTHGLVSVNPDKMLIAFHHDWVRNFPFEAMGLSDKYKVAPPNMLDYGFTYDEDILDKLNRTLWPGAISAEDDFNKRAEKQRANVDVLRRKLRDRYLSQLENTRKLRLDANGNAVVASQSPGSADSAETGNHN